MRITRIFIALSAAALAQAAAAGQSPEPFFPSRAGTVLEYLQTDASGEPLMFLTDSIAEFSGDFLKGTARVVSSTQYPGDSLTIKADEAVRFENGEVIYDYAETMEESLVDMVRQSLEMAGADEADIAEAGEVLGEVKVKGECRGIPAQLSVGMELPDYEVEVKVMFVTTKASCKDRKVVGREEIVTPAGSFDCYVVEEKTSVKTFMTNVKNSQKTWYARGVGMVRQQVWDKKKLVSTTELTAIR